MNHSCPISGCFYRFTAVINDKLYSSNCMKYRRCLLNRWHNNAGVMQRKRSVSQWLPIIEIIDIQIECVLQSFLSQKFVYLLFLFYLCITYLTFAKSRPSFHLYKLYTQTYTWKYSYLNTKTWGKKLTTKTLISLEHFDKYFFALKQLQTRELWENTNVLGLEMANNFEDLAKDPIGQIE